jgi:hypothetical protein
MTSIPYKQWRYEEAQRAGLTESAIAMRVGRGCYPQLRLNRVNARVVQVVQGSACQCSYRSHPDLAGLGRKTYHRLLMRRLRARKQLIR